jgi:bis(5'-nucleosyl)-tetraphosphatase (symmetrical)
MATWVIGDVQGCFDSLEALLGKIEFSPTDRLWFVGDLVNRGPRNVAVLRWVRDLGERAVVVLGNHDLHVIGRALGVFGPKRRDTIDDVLSAPDRDALIDWLRRRPFVHRDGRWLMVHAGLLPSWTVDDAELLARSYESQLASNDAARLLSDESDGLQAMVRLRMLDKKGRPLDFDGAPRDAPRSAIPWFDAPERRWRDVTVLFGHWSQLGFHRSDDAICLDSGCVWGHQLTAFRLDDGAIRAVDAVEPAAPF